MREGIIVAVEITDRRNDAALAVPMVEGIVQRYGAARLACAAAGLRVLVDTNYATSADIVALAEHPVGPATVFAPPPSECDDVKSATLAKRAKARAQEPDSLKEWRARMASAEGQAIYRSRKLIERINGHCKNHGFGFIAVRGRVKARAVALLPALANNLLAAHQLRTQAA